MELSTDSKLIDEKYYKYYSNNVNYYRDYSDYLTGRRCCKKSISSLYPRRFQTGHTIGEPFEIASGNELNNILGKQRCYGNNINSYNNYGDFLRDKNCFSKLVVFDAYLKYIKKM